SSVAEAGSAKTTEPAKHEFDRTSLRPYAYVAGGIGAAGLLTFVIAGVLSNSTYGDLQNTCGNAACPASMSDEISRGKTEQTIANVGLVFAILGVGTGAALYVISMPPKDSKSTTASISPVVSVGYAGLRGSF
ncbi:MAG: hypothetical protein ABI461_15560, partial [Polyangiaceae bacterium]